MNVYLYKLNCLTNLHVGSGDFNYGVVDNEVERDCLSGNPVIHASGIKGALRDVAEKALDKNSVSKIFGGPGENNTTKEGTHKFFDAHLLSRPLRVSGNESISYISVTTPEIINNFIDTLDAFGIDHDFSKIGEVDFKKNKFYSNVENIYIESDEESCKTHKVDEKTAAVLDKILGGKYAIVKSLNDFKLPVIARNKVGENLWYEEFVPHHSVFYTMIMCEGDIALDFSKPIQFGGNSSIGYGYTKVDAFEVKK